MVEFKNGNVNDKNVFNFCFLLNRFNAICTGILLLFLNPDIVLLVFILIYYCSMELLTHKEINKEILNDLASLFPLEYDFQLPMTI